MRLLDHPNPNAPVLRLLAAGADDDYADLVDDGEYLRTREPGGFVLRLPEGDAAKVRNFARLFSFRRGQKLARTVTIDNRAVGQAETAAFFGGLLLGAYRHNDRQSEPERHFLAGADAGAGLTDRPGATVDAVQRELQLVAAQLTAMRLVDTPANFKNPRQVAAIVSASAKEHGFKLTVMDKAACEQNGFGALLAVNRGSEDPAKFMVLEHRGRGAGAGKTVAIVGKGVTFDTGGISIKPSSNLHLMKSDLGGAAATLGTLEAAASLDLPVHLIGIIPATDNSVDALSIKPSDVITGHSGKTIEIIDTDAEGRLILSDGLSYAVKTFNPDYLVSVATLTGSAVRTFGYECAAAFGTDRATLDGLLAAGERCGERCWPLPGWDSFAKGLESDVADIKNYSGKPLHGATDAFKFLEFFTHEHPRYCHLDIAGVALKQGPYAKDRQGTGFGVRLFVEWLAGL